MFQRRWYQLESKTRTIIIASAVTLLIAIALVIFFLTNSYLARTMRLTAYEGYVSIESADGSSLPVIRNVRFESGQALTTSTASSASITLDNSKLITLNEESRAEFTKAARMISLQLTKGSLFFDVQKPLSDDETFDIRTSTMVVGIRGTSGYVYTDLRGEDQLILTSGQVHVVGTNPTTGEVKEIDVHAGQRITTYLFNDRDTDTIEFFLEDISEYDLNLPTLRYLVLNPDLLEKVCAETGWSSSLIRQLATGLGIEPVVETEETETTETIEAEATPTNTSTPTPTPVDEDADLTPTSTATPTPVSTTTAATTAATTTDSTTAATAAATATPAPSVATSTPAPTRAATPTPAPTRSATPTPAPTRAATPTPAPTAAAATATPMPERTPTPTTRPINTPTPVPTTRPTRPSETEATEPGTITTDPVTGEIIAS